MAPKTTNNNNESNEAIVARVDERTKAIQNDLIQLRKDIENTAMVTAAQSKTTSDALELRVRETALLLETRVKETADALAQKVREHEERSNKQFEATTHVQEEMLQTLEKNYVKKSEFTPVQKLVYGFFGIIVMSVVVALVATVIRTSQVPSERVTITPSIGLSTK